MRWLNDIDKFSYKHNKVCLKYEVPHEEFMTKPFKKSNDTRTVRNREYSPIANCQNINIYIYMIQSLGWHYQSPKSPLAIKFRFWRVKSQFHGILAIENFSVKSSCEIRQVVCLKHVRSIISVI